MAVSEDARKLIPEPVAVRAIRNRSRDIALTGPMTLRPEYRKPPFERNCGLRFWAVQKSWTAGTYTGWEMKQSALHTCNKKA